MREVKRSALIAESPARMYQIINDIERYPEFVPGCLAARVESRQEHEVVATLEIRKGAPSIRTENAQLAAYIYVDTRESDLGAYVRRAQEAVAGGHDAALPPQQRVFFYMPYQHSESRLVHVEAERLFTALGSADFLDHERRHKAIVDRYGRYPHRNEALGRTSTPEELRFLAEPGSRF